MSDQTDNYLKLLTPFGLIDQEAKIYLFLLQNGFSTALTISRELHLARTKVYRILDKLKHLELVEYQLEDRGLRFGATHPQKLTQIALEKEQQAHTLIKMLPQLISKLNHLVLATKDESKVLYYEGTEGLKQVSYNALKAQKILRVFEMEHISSFLPVDFAENFRNEMVKNQCLTKDLTNKPKFPGFTDVKNMIPKYSQFRYIDPQKLKIEFETLIYNDVYATYTYKGAEIFCVEIYNSHLAHMQKQLFDYIWSQATPMKFLDKRGAAEVCD